MATQTTVPDDLLLLMMRYRAWANDLAYRAVADISLEEALRPRATTFGNIVRTLNHIYVVDDLFRHHLTGQRHGYSYRNTDDTPALSALTAKAREMDRWYIAQVASWSPRERNEIVHFQFVDGGKGAMTREQIALHVINHATYHRGFVGDMLKQIPYFWAANDLPVFLRDHSDWMPTP